MKKSLLLLLLIVLSVNILIAQTVTGKLVNQKGESQSGLQLTLYVNPTVYTTESSSDGSFTFGNLTGLINIQLPAGYAISECYPNPFSQTTRINMTLPKGGNIKVDVYNLQGQKAMSVTDRYYESGENYIDIDFRGFIPGNYLAKITIDNQFTISRKMLLQNGSIQSTSVDKDVRFKSPSLINSTDETKIDSLVVSGASIDKKVFINLPALSGETVNLGVLTVTETNNMIDGASFFNGSVPAIGLVTYQEGANQVTDSAYLGQVCVFFKASVSQSNATNILKASGGSVLTKVPHAGYYLAGVSIGKEGAFIEALRKNIDVKTAFPNVVASYMSSGVTVIDGCGKSHGDQVSCTVSQHTPYSTTVSCLDDDDGKGRPFSDKSITQIMSTIADANGGNAIINISSFGGLNRVDYETEDSITKATLLRLAKDYLSEILIPISQLPESWTKNLVITFCAGNDNTPLTSVLAELRSDSLIAKVLNDNVLIVGANESVYHDSNDAPGDPAFANMRSVTSCDQRKGTSFAAPLAAAYISNLVNVKGITARQALKAAKIAISQNPENEFIEEEAQMIAELIKKGKVYSGGSFSVTQTSLQSNGDYTYDTLTIALRFDMTIVPDGSSYDMIAPAHLSWIWKNCEEEIAEGSDPTEESLADQVFKCTLSVSNETYTGSATTDFVLFSDKMDEKMAIPVTAKFTGSLNTNGIITGTMSLFISNKLFNQTTSVTLTKQ